MWQYRHTDELYHHGVKGQRWGVRRYQNYDGTLTAAGKARRNGTTYSGKSKDPNDHHAKDNNWKEVTRLTYSTLISIATLNPVGLAVNSARLVQAGQAYAKSKKFNTEKSTEEIDPKTGFRLKSKEMTMKEDCVRVNPNFRNFNSNTKNNCMLCTSTYDLRRRGYDVEALTASVGYKDGEVKKWYPKATFTTLISDSKNPFFTDREMTTMLQKDLLAQGDGARGNIMFQWRESLGGHSVAYEVQNNQLMIVDAQANKIYKNPSAVLNKMANTSVTYVRLDNIDFDPEAIKEVAK